MLRVAEQSQTITVNVGKDFQNLSFNKATYCPENS